MENEPRHDIALMLKVREGDAKSFCVLHDRYQRKLLGFFYGLAGDSGAASDLCQETFLRVWQLRLRYRASGPFPAYLFAVARLIWQEHLRRERKLWRLGHPASIEEGHLSPTLANTHPDARAARAELGEQLLAALQQLPEEQRMVFMMRHVRGLSLDEIAAALDCPVNTVRSRKILAVKKLRHLLAADWEEPTRPAAKESEV